MKFFLVIIGKTQNLNIKKGFEEYARRIGKYADFDVIEIKQPKFSKKISIAEIKKKESELFDEKLKGKNNILLLDEKGKEYTSVEFARMIEKKINGGNNEFYFVIGGSYGFSEEFSAKYPKMALSKMTFPHDLVRLFFVEQLYRALTILANEKYHH